MTKPRGSRRLLVAAILLLLMGGGNALCASSILTPAASQLNAEAVDLMTRGDFPAALQLLLRANRASSDGVIRANLAACYLQLGLQQLQAGRAEEASQILLEGESVAGEDDRFRLYRGAALYHLGRYDEAEGELNHARAIDEKPETLRLLGQVLYASGRLNEAITVWREALEKGGWDEKLSAQVDKAWAELKVEQTMNNEFGSNFVISYDGRAYPELGGAVLETLEEAYNQIGRELDFYPQVQVPVLLYTQRDFSELTGSPDWAGGLYDGKIRIPVGGIDGMNPQLRAVLYHEYVHVVVRYLTSGHCPVWLNEGLAEAAARRHYDPPLDRLRQAFKGNALIAFEQMESSFMSLGRERVELAYQQSYSLVDYMIEQFHWYKMAELLRVLGRGKQVAGAIDEVLGEYAVDYAGLQTLWRQSLFQ